MKNLISEHNRWLVTSLAPLIIFLIVFTLVPLINVFYMSFFDIRWQDTGYNYDFIGLGNYRALPDDKFFVPGIRNTFVFAIVCVSIQMVLGFTLAYFITRIKRGKSFLISLFLLPVLLPPIVIGSVWRLMYGFDFGIINYLLGLVGIMPVDWLGSHSLAFTSIVIVDVWHWTPFVFLLLLAGLESIPQEQRLCLELAYFEGKTQREIAEETRTALGTIKSRMRIGLEKLERLLRSAGHRGEPAP